MKKKLKTLQIYINENQNVFMDYNYQRIITVVLCLTSDESCSRPSGAIEREWLEPGPDIDGRDVVFTVSQVLRVFEDFISGCSDRDGVFVDLRQL